MRPSSKSHEASSLFLEPRFDTLSNQYGLTSASRFTVYIASAVVLAELFCSESSRRLLMIARLLLSLLLIYAGLAGGAAAQGKERIEKAADLPRFNYPITGKVEDLLHDDARFKSFAGAV